MNKHSEWLRELEKGARLRMVDIDYGRCIFMPEDAKQAADALDIYEQAFEDAPHTMSCSINIVNKVDGVVISRCNCWKDTVRAALAKLEDGK